MFGLSGFKDLRIGGAVGCERAVHTGTHSFNFRALSKHCKIKALQALVVKQP